MGTLVEGILLSLLLALGYVDTKEYNVEKIVVNTNTEQVLVYDTEVVEPIKVFECSTGLNGNTYLGNYKTSKYYEDWHPLYGGVYGRYSIRFNNDELFHSVPYYSMNLNDLEYEEYNKLGTPASMGCVRMSAIDVKWLFDNTDSGTPVSVIDDDITYKYTHKHPYLDETNIETRGTDPTDKIINYIDTLDLNVMRD